MRHQIRLWGAVAGLIAASFLAGLVKGQEKSSAPVDTKSRVPVTTQSDAVNPAKGQVSPDALMSDHDKIEKLRQQVAELQDKLANLTQEYGAHTHRLRVGVTRIPLSIDCDIDNFGGNIKKLCHQLGDENISVMYAPDQNALVTTAPHP
jgi:hypothetical protein